MQLARLAAGRMATPWAVVAAGMEPWSDQTRAVAN
jgi:hypothetical protein